MRRVREILRLKHECGATDRAIARSLSIARSTVALTLERVAATGLRWPLPAALSDRVLEAMLYAGHGSQQGARRKTEPDWAYVHHELRRPGVTLMLLWEEYRQRDPGGYRYSRWCELYRAWEGRLSPTMRQAHPAGERMFVDYAGQTVDLIDGRTGEIRAAQIFVAAMGASNYTYAEASWTQTLPDWIGAHVRALAFMGGVPAQLVPDNPKVGVDRANWYEPGINRTYLGLATHYGTAILPTRTRKPRDKAKVEVAVLVVERWILARLRNRRFFSLAELNQAIAEHMPSAHRRYAEWTIERIAIDAAAIGPSTAKLAALILQSRPHPEQGYRACIGILRLARQYGADRLEAACDRGLDIGARSYGSIQSILKHGLDKRPARAARQGELLPDHPNIRGSRYYH